MVDYVPIEKAMAIRQPSTANLMLDSFDRTTGSAGNFSIQRNASIMNGFFTRIATTEVVLEWDLPNITANLNDTFKATIGVTEYTIVLPEGFYTLAQCLDNIVVALNAKAGISGVYTFAISQVGGNLYLTCVLFGTSTPQSYVLETNTTLIQQLGLRINLASASKQIGLVKQPDIRSYRYLDFVSNQLTYAQDLKDSSTAVGNRDVLCRWYLAWDNPPTLDKYGLPILQGYTQFQQRRLFNPAKQIRWEPNLPIGNLSFQVFFNSAGASGADILLDDLRFEWLMTLQVSEQ
jgi:hypothetical protein